MRERPILARLAVLAARGEGLVAYIRARGWTYHPADRKPWHCGRVAVETAAEALSLELGEQRIELR